MAASGIKRSGLAVALRVAMLPLALCGLAAAQAADKSDGSPVCVALRQARPATWVKVDRVPAAEAALVLGDGYGLEIRHGEAVQKCRGPLIQLTDQWVVLRQEVRSMSVEGVPYLMDVPLLGRLFRRTNDELAAENDVWIPRSAATIESHLKVTRRATEMPHPADAPPLNATCYVLVAIGDKAETYNGVLTQVGDGDVTMVVRDDGRVLKIARADYLSVVIVDTGTQHTGKAEGGADQGEAKTIDDAK